MFDTGVEPTTSVVGGRRLDDWVTTILKISKKFRLKYVPMYHHFVQKFYTFSAHNWFSPASGNFHYKMADEA